MKVEIGNNIIVFDVQYGNREKLSIQIDSTGLVTVKAPKKTTEDTVIRAVEQNSKWILEKLYTISELRKMPKAKEYHDQEKFLYLGKEYSLHELIETNNLGEEELKNSLKKFYISRCKQIVGERIKNYEQQLGVKPKAIEVVESKTQWGSCNSNKKITFNYRLSMAPVEVIDYVIVHELCHLIHMNHDRSFWRRVGSILPDYKKRQELLMRLGHYMTL
ncbi:M48 family metallopeptidase [Geosporobacter ferrireducens]|uniref:YgjP-like metallopeptidase domain-containing protein n=1 Tax=Geosporobacter ferrireducens TaxID=1424294 RepID=A0A1D8GQR9_9FIRM|nr:SprT family zinc-dependent metalloprotease [Geosporobacter ferrireducens]AOT73266.1 hypothetical protein Gferi_22430 [Geosporobacter ferrireducens]MTI55932.1 M48 family metallopeptidase [Geosporobacter ferrireducens]